MTQTKGVTDTNKGRQRHQGKQRPRAETRQTQRQWQRKPDTEKDKHRAKGRERQTQRQWQRQTDTVTKGRGSQTQR